MHKHFASVKSILNISLSLILLMSTIGITISKHYCGDLLITKSVILKANPCCDSGQMPEGCCHDKSDSFSIEDDFQLTQITYNQDLTVGLLTFNDFFHLKFDQNIIEPDSSLAESPPPIPETPIYIQVQSFLI
ncbi:hypothetical protein [Reichenbachiella sp. MALMAid0571]|uniref:HYC_CC_PP family protein n=1 Tax=Reichenbachiella sp. MALMAid0571 TaxID=3143939 RepID=UPI0032DF5552